MDKGRPKVARVSVYKAIETLVESGARKATVFQHPELTVVATRRHKPNKRERSTNILLTIGRPNFRNRELIKSLVVAGTRFPLRSPRLEFYERGPKCRLPARTGAE